MRKILGRNFFNRDTAKIAEELLGKFLVRKIKGKEITGMITETEAYDGPYDLASHAAKGRTERTEIMFGYPGHFYVYLCYGVHWMLNIVARERGYPAAVLIRGINNVAGPGKLAKFFKIDKRMNGRLAGKSSGLWVEDRAINISKNKIKVAPRVGVAYAGPVWSRKKLRFLLE